MWGFDRHGVIPDMVSLGKPMGNGYPVAGLVMRPEVIAEFGGEARYFNTFGGNAVAAAVALAVLDVIRDEGLMQNAATTGAAFLQGLRALQTPGGAMGEVRGAGLFIGADIVNDDGSPSPARAARLVNRLRDRRILISATGARGHILKIRPPLPFTPEDAAQVTTAIADLLPAL
jgi:4-aminobutyrate aminotransferase-like enzyme